MDTLEYILDKYNIDWWKDYNSPVKLPIEIPNTGREQMANLFNELGFKIGAEIGVRGGDYSKILCEAIPGVKMYGIDPYEPHEGYKDIQRRSTFDSYMEAAYKKLEPFDYEFMRMYSVDAASKFADESLDFVYIDGDHAYESVVNDISLWSKKVRKGGIISGDDYFKHKGPSHIHVYEAVNGYTAAWQIKPWFVLGSKAIVEGEIRDHGRSWMWVKC